MTTISSLAPDTANAFADCALHCVLQRYPYAMPHLMRGPGDRPEPGLVHPIFCGSYDWHSSVHMHWSLVRLLRLVPDLLQREAIMARFATAFTSDAVAAELVYLQRNPGFERPYGWAWLMMLHAELLDAAGDIPEAADWALALQPMADLLVQRSSDFWSLAHYPQRAGTHTNSAFAMVLMSSFARRRDDMGFLSVLNQNATRYFAADRSYPARYEPSGSDFLSGGLCEAVLMAEQLGPQFETWWKNFSPPPDEWDHWMAPAVVSSRTDGQLVHLDGLNLSRAWCLRSLARCIPAQRGHLEAAAQAHLRASLPHVTGGDFVATHWLVSFALLALTGL